MRHKAIRRKTIARKRWNLEITSPRESTVCRPQEALKPQATTSYDDTTAILQTSLHGHADVVAELLAARADVNVRRSDPGIMDCGATALLLAAKRGHSETVKLLLRGRCDVNASNVNAEGALYCMGQLPTIVLIPCSYCWRQGPIFTKDVNMGRYPLPYMLQPKGISRRLLNCWCLLELI